MNPGVDYVHVVDRLTDAIKELNQPCVAPAAPAERIRSAEERQRDAVEVLRELLRALDAGAGADPAAAAAEHTTASATNRPTHIQIRILMPYSLTNKGFKHVDLVYETSQTVLTIKERLNAVLLAANERKKSRDKLTDREKEGLQPKNIQLDAQTNRRKLENNQTLSDLTGYVLLMRPP